MKENITCKYRRISGFRNRSGYILTKLDSRGFLLVRFLTCTQVFCPYLNCFGYLLLSSLAALKSDSMSSQNLLGRIQSQLTGHQGVFTREFNTPRGSRTRKITFKFRLKRKKERKFIFPVVFQWVNSVHTLTNFFLRNKLQKGMQLKNYYIPRQVEFCYHILQVMLSK